MSKSFFTLFLILFGVSDAARILAVFSTLSYADHLIYRGYVESLARKQHHIIYMTPYPGMSKYPEAERITEIDVSEASQPFLEEYRRIITSTDDYLTVLTQLNGISLRIAVAQIRSQQMTSLLVNPNITVDLIITEADVPLLYAFTAKYKAPHIAITASHGKINMYDSKGNPNHPLLYPDVYTLNYGNLTLWQRMREVARHLRFRYEYYSKYLPKCQELGEKMFDLKRDLREVECDIDLLLVSGTHMLIGNRPTVPAIVYVDRLHIKSDEALPQDLKKVLDDSEGFVYFSLGAAREADTFPQQTVQAILEAFKELPYTMLCKLHNTTTLALPQNVVARNWVPQQAVLAHPKIKAFVTHGGPRSLEESIYYEAPVVVVPMVAGLKVFAQQVVKFRTGVILDPDYLDKDVVKAAVLNVANNSTYKKAMTRLRYLAFDQPMSGPERAAWWTEYVLRHNGARHLRAPAVGVPLYRYFMLDVLAVLLALVCSFALATFVLVRTLLARRKWRPWKEADGKWKML